MCRSRRDLHDCGAYALPAEFAGAIHMGRARRAHAASPAWPSAINPNFRTILDAIIARRRLADVRRADLARTISAGQASQAVGAIHHASATAIDIRFVAILDLIGTGGLGAFAHFTKSALTIGVDDARQAGATRLTDHSAAIDVRFAHVFHLIDAYCRHTMIHGTDVAHRHTIGIERAFDTGAFSIANHRPHGAARAGCSGRIRAFARYATFVDRAFFTIIQNVRRIHDTVDTLSSAITLIDFAIRGDLLHDRRALVGEHLGTFARNARLETAFVVFTRTIRIGEARSELDFRYIEAWIGCEIIDAINEMAGGYGAPGDEKSGTGQKNEGYSSRISMSHQNCPRIPAPRIPTIGWIWNAAFVR